MGINPNALYVEQVNVVHGLGPVTPSTSVPKYVCLKGYGKCTIYIQGLNATTVTGSAITLKQATAVANTGEKALAFDTVYANIDTDASDTKVKTAVSSNTFTTTAVNSKKFQYIIEVKPSDLDINNSFDCIRLGTGDGTAVTLAVSYHLWPLRYGGPVAYQPSAILD